jgi:hypothetical protein
MREVETKKELLQEIFDVTSKIQYKYPELYSHLNETPLFLSSRDDEIRSLDFQQYHESLSIQIMTIEKAAQT